MQHCEKQKAIVQGKEVYTCLCQVFMNTGGVATFYLAFFPSAPACFRALDGCLFNGLQNDSYGKYEGID